MARGIASARSTTDTTPLSRSRDSSASPHAQHGVAKPKQRTCSGLELALGLGLGLGVGLGLAVRLRLAAHSRLAQSRPEQQRKQRRHARA